MNTSIQCRDAKSQWLQVMFALLLFFCLALADMQWTFFDKEIVSLTTTNIPSLPINVATTSERILEAMDRITGMYEKLSQ